MRIIAGRHRGRNILPPDSQTTRPITNRAKQSLFDILAPRIEESVVLDLFAGTGSMGLESLSRGAQSVTFFERDRSALARLRTNLATLGEQSRASVIDKDIFRWFAPPAVGRKSPAADLIFLDPPYRYVRENLAELQALAGALAAHYLRPAGLLIFRYQVGDTLDLPGLERIDHRTYGSMAIDIFQLPQPSADEIDTFAKGARQE